MTTFLDGPAAGIALELTRAPLLLRVVVNKAGQWDALDQLEDQPRPGETIHVYQQASFDGRVHLYRRGKGARSGWLTIASYRLFPRQPADQEIRTTAAWRAWTTEQVTPDGQLKAPPEGGDR